MFYIFAGHRERRKIHRLYSWDVRGWSSDKKEWIFLSVDPFKGKTNQHRTLHLDP